MRICTISYCDNKHEAHGYCRRHYRSYQRYGDALYVDNQRKELAEKKGQPIDLNKKRPSRRPKCSVDGCDSPIKAFNLCEKHYARMRYSGSLELTIKPNEIEVDQCLAMECNRTPKIHGFCEPHYRKIRKEKTPYQPKILKLCGISECIEIHYAKGLCEQHFREWKKTIKDYSLDDYFPLK